MKKKQFILKNMEENFQWDRRFVMKRSSTYQVRIPALYKYSNIEK